MDSIVLLQPHSFTPLSAVMFSLTLLTSASFSYLKTRSKYPRLIFEKPVNTKQKNLQGSEIRSSNKYPCS